MRRHGRDYVTAVVMLSDMRKHDRLPAEMHIAINAEFVQVARYARSFLDLKEEDEPDDDSDVSTAAATAELVCLPCGEENGYKDMVPCVSDCDADHHQEDEDDYFWDK